MQNRRCTFRVVVCALIWRQKNPIHYTRWIDIFLARPRLLSHLSNIWETQGWFSLRRRFCCFTGVSYFFLSFVYYIFFARYSISSLQKLLKCKRWKLFFSICLFHSLRGVSSHIKKNEISRNKIIFFILPLL